MRFTIITRGLGSGGLITQGFSPGAIIVRVRREVMRLVSAIHTTMELRSPWKRMS